MPDTILCIGLVCADIVSYVKKFIAEDSKQRDCQKQTWERGGNATNNATVLAKLGSPVEFLGTMANDHLLGFLGKDMTELGINYQHCPILDGFQTPTSVVISSEETGSRTIIHCSGRLPELSLENFKNAIELNEYKWVHAEGLNAEELLKILENIQEYNAKCGDTVSNEVLNYKKRKLPVSVEVEIVRRPLIQLLKYADVAFIGREYSEFMGAKNPVDAAILGTKFVQNGTLVICPWGDKGATYCISTEEPKVITVEAYPPTTIVDSLGAGDTFDAAVIFALSNGLDVDSSVRFGCKVAGGKLGQHGFKQIDTFAKDLLEFKQIAALH